MRIGSLSLFARTNGARHFNIAAYHSPHSLTWSWIWSVSFDGTWRKPNGWPRFGMWVSRHNTGCQGSITLPFVVLHRHAQHPMWYRDLFRRAREREDELERANSKLRHELTKTRAMAMAGLVEPRQ